MGDSYAEDHAILSPSKGQSLPRSVEFVSSALQRVGIDKSINLMSNQPEDVAETCDAIYTLLVKHEKDIEYKEKLKGELLETRQFLQLEKKEKLKLRNQIDSKEKELKSWEAKARVKDETWKDDATKAKREVEDLRRRLKGSESKVVHMAHELKKKEKEYEKLQERLSKYLTDKKKCELAATDIAGKLVKGGGSSTSSGNRHIRCDDGIQSIVTSYENKQAQHVKEINELKAALASLQTEHARAMNAATDKRQVTTEVETIVDKDFMEKIPHMSANELGAELSTRIKTLQRRLNSLDWQANNVKNSVDGVLSIRETRLLEELSAARMVLHDQQLLLTNVLVSLRSALAAEHQNFEIRLRERVKKFEESLETMKRSYSSKETEQEAEVQLRIRALEQEYQEGLASERSAKKSLEEKIQVLQSRVDILQNRHKEALEEEVERARAEFESEIHAVRSGAEATMESMAAESSEIQLDLKRTQTALRAEAAALRERLIMEQTERENVQKASTKMVEEAVLAEQGRLLSKVKELEASRDEAISNVEKSYNAKMDLLVKEKAELEEQCEATNVELMMTKDKLEETQECLRSRSERLVEVEKEVLQLKKNAPETLSLGIASALEKAEKHHAVEKQELIDRFESLQQELRSAQSSIADKTRAMQVMEEKGAEAEKVVSQYSEMTEYYKDLMARYAPGLGAGLFLERAIQRKATSLAMA
ncbi:hypothetical protein M9434_007180 [Picochlorum sp. BPE23]|nr:hypothetical protein M9434_007180 [Picochlorum sp. BPE23]